MVVRLAAFVLALGITFAPVITIACEGLCAVRANDAGTTNEHHSCHHEAAPANETAISSVAHLCGHADEGPTAVAQSASMLTAPAIIVATFDLAPPTVEVAVAGVAPAHAPPLISSRSAQLRI